MTSGSRHADTLFYGSVITMDRARPRAGGVAVKGEKILAVGDAAELHEFAGPGTRVVNLGSRTLAPGLHDAHVHLTGTGEELDHVQLYSAATLEEAFIIQVAPGMPGEFLRGFRVQPSLCKVHCCVGISTLTQNICTPPESSRNLLSSLAPQPATVRIMSLRTV